MTDLLKPLHPKGSVEITGLWLRRIGEHAEVLVEVDGKWRLCIREYYDGNYGHICEPSGIMKAKIEP